MKWSHRGAPTPPNTPSFSSEHELESPDVSEYQFTYSSTRHIAQHSATEFSFSIATSNAYGIDVGVDDESSEAGVTGHVRVRTDVSSLCCTLYPFDDEPVKHGLHFTKTTGIQRIIDEMHCDREEYDNSHGGSVTDPVQTGALFSSKFEQIEYLPIINDGGAGHPHPNYKRSPSLPPFLGMDDRQRTESLPMVPQSSPLDVSTIASQSPIG